MVSDLIAALARLGVRLPVQAHDDDSSTIADADGVEICVIDPNSQRDDDAAFEITELLVALINAAAAPLVIKAPDAKKIGDEAVAIANEIGAVLEGKDTAACYVALSMVLGTAAAMGGRPDFAGTMKLVERGARDSFDHYLKERGRG